MTKTISSSLIKDTKGILALCQDSQNPIIVQTNGTPVLVLMDAAAFEYQFKDSRKLPDILKRISHRPLRLPITILKYTSKTVDTCNKADEPTYLQRYNRDELVIMSPKVFERIVKAS